MISSRGWHRCSSADEMFDFGPDLQSSGLCCIHLPDTVPGLVAHELRRFPTEVILVCASIANTATATAISGGVAQLSRRARPGRLALARRLRLYGLHREIQTKQRDDGTDPPFGLTQGGAGQGSGRVASGLPAEGRWN